MRRLLRAALLLTATVMAACGGSDGPVATIATGSDTVAVAIEIADTAEERRVGLMGRESLPADAGMLFVYDAEHSGGYWMKDTLVPLSIAFIDGRGTVLAILDMEPCRADPCPIYDPGVAYERALEVNRGAFRRWGVEVGDVVTVER
jgi:uncharacterized membrane protein (UPF0127 family)